MVEDQRVTVRGRPLSAHDIADVVKDIKVIKDRYPKTQQRETGARERGKKFFSRLLRSDDAAVESKQVVPTRRPAEAKDNRKGYTNSKERSDSKWSDHSSVDLSSAGQTAALHLLDSDSEPESKPEPLQRPSALVPTTALDNVRLQKQTEDRQSNSQNGTSTVKLKNPLRRFAKMIEHGNIIYREFSSREEAETHGYMGEFMLGPSTGLVWRSRQVYSLGKNDGLDGIETSSTMLSRDKDRREIIPVRHVLPDKSQGISNNPGMMKPQSTSTSSTHTSPEDYGWSQHHLTLNSTDEEILEAINPLGHGSVGVVEEVRHNNGLHPSLVRKRIHLPISKEKAAAYRAIAQEEARILRSLIHPHIITLIGSYDDLKHSRRSSYCLLMSPVGEHDLETLLAIVGEHAASSPTSLHWKPRIKQWMACLASALSYMHASGIRHQDIKPSNIIHKSDLILFTDFSSSAAFKIGHTTSTDSPARSTPMYGAPEVTAEMGTHGRTADIFALGCVFCDMLSVIEGRTVALFQDFLRGDAHVEATRMALSYCEKTTAIHSWFRTSTSFEDIVAPMLHLDRTRRPSAAEVVRRLGMSGCGTCACIQTYRAVA